MRALSVLATFAVLTSSPVSAHEFQLGDLHIGHPFARTTAPQQPSGGAYLSIENRGKETDRLIKASADIAKETQIHSMKMDGNVMRMREIEKIDITPGAKVSMKPGDGYHIMLIGLKQPLKAGDKFPVTLTFEKAGQTVVTVVVEEREKAAPGAAMRHHH